MPLKNLSGMLQKPHPVHILVSRSFKILLDILPPKPKSPKRTRPFRFLQLKFCRLFSSLHLHMLHPSRPSEFDTNNIWWVTRWRSWQRSCVTSRKIAEGFITDGVTGNFHGPNPSGRNMALESTQPPTEYQGCLLGV
jgi:hypothetical protein